MRAMPSPTESTVPTSLICASVPKLAIWSLMTLEISAARISMFSLSSALHRLGVRIETGADRTVDPLGPDGDDKPAEQVGGDRGPDLHIAALAGLQFLLQRLDLR